MLLKDKVAVGDVIHLYHKECQMISGDVVGEYVVEETKESCGWHVFARKLDEFGCYVPDSTLVQFHQCAGYLDSVSKIEVVRQIIRIFV